MTLEKFIVFQLGTEEYAIRVENVKSIEKMEKITRVPNTDKYIKGVLNLRGIITPIIDLKMRLSIGQIEITKQTRIIIISNSDMDVGFIVDAANDVLDFDMSEVEDNPEAIDGIEVDFIQGVIKYEDRYIILLHLEKILERQD